MENSFFPPMPITGLNLENVDQRQLGQESGLIYDGTNVAAWPHRDSIAFPSNHPTQDYRTDNQGSESTSVANNNNKRTRTTRSCDQCRRKKVKCGGGAPCDVCRVFGLTCSYNDPTRKRGPPAKLGGRAEKDRRARQSSLLPGFLTTDARLDHARSSSVSKEEDCSDTAQSREGSIDTSSDDDWTDDLDNNHGGSIVVDERNQERYFGEGSFLGLLKIIDAKKKGSKRRPGRSAPNEYFGRSEGASIPMRRTPSTPYEGTVDRLRPQLPPTDLLAHLVSLYFFRIAVIFPVLHRPSFEKALGEFLASDTQDEDVNKTPVKDGVSPMYSNALALSICALGSLGTTDERAKRDPADPTSVGATFADRAITLRMTGLYRAGVHSVQALANLAMFRFAQGETAAGYILVGDAVRLSQNLGMHRTIKVGRFPRIEGEVRKRTWIQVYLLDRYTAILLGRPTLIRDCDCDVEVPAEVDDEYLNDTDVQEPKQPEGEPSVIIAYNYLYKGARIMGRIVNLLYAAKHEDEYGNPIEPDLETIATALDKQTEEWHDAMPPHLREAANISDRNTTGRDVLWAVQASRVEIEYQAVKLLIHRAFISKESVKPDGRIGSHFFSAIRAALQLANNINEMQRRGFGFFILITHMHFGLEASIFLCIAAGQLCKANQANSQQLIGQIQAVLSEQIEVYSRLTTYRFSIQAVDLIVDALRVCEVTIGRPLSDVKVANIPWYSVHVREDSTADERSSTSSPPSASSRKTSRNLKSMPVTSHQLRSGQVAQDSKVSKPDPSNAGKMQQYGNNQSTSFNTTTFTPAQLRSLGLGNLGLGGGLSPMLNSFNMNQYFNPEASLQTAYAKQGQSAVDLTSQQSASAGSSAPTVVNSSHDAKTTQDNLVSTSVPVLNHFTFPENYTFDAMQADASHGSALYPCALSQIFPSSPAPNQVTSNFGLEEWLSTFNGLLGGVPT